MKPRKEKTIKCSTCDIEFKSRSNRVWYCKKCAKLNRYFIKNHSDYKYRLKRLLAMAKNRAITKGLPFNLEHQDLIALWEENDGHCCLTGRKLLLDISDISTVHPDAPSLDRIVPSFGYTKGNVRIITYHMNIALSDFGIQQFEALIKSFMASGVAH